MAGARALWRATGMKDDDFNKPMIAIANSYTQFVPGHVHLKDMGDLVAAEIAKVAVLPGSFILLRWMTALPWATTVCSILCHRGILSLTLWNIWSMPTVPMHWYVFPTATRLLPEC